MPPLKAAPSLEDLTSRALGAQVSQSLVHLELTGKCGPCPELTDTLDQLPTSLLESLVLHCTRLLTRTRSRVGLITSLKLLPGPRLTQLDLSPLFSGARLSRALNRDVRGALEVSLARCTHLSRLVLKSKCTDQLLSVLGTNCPRLQELHISLSEQVTDQGLVHLVPRQEDGRVGCPLLTTLDLLKCWNISPAGAESLLLGLPRLSRLMFPNMKSVVELLQSRPARPPFPLQYFDSSEYLLVTDSSTAPDTSTANMTDIIPQIPLLFPHLTTLRMLVSDPELTLLNQLPHLVHLELELSDEPSSGLQHLLDSHPNTANFLHMFLQVGPLQASHLLSLARHCKSLVLLRIIAFQVDSPSLLHPNPTHFNRLEQLHLSLYDDSVDTDSEEEQDEQQGGPTRHTQQILDFFLVSSTQLKVANVHMNCTHFLTNTYLFNLLRANNPLVKLERLNLSGPHDLNLDGTTLSFLLDNLPRLSYLNTSRWGNLDRGDLAVTKDMARINNWNIVVE